MVNFQLDCLSEIVKKTTSLRAWMNSPTFTFCVPSKFLALIRMISHYLGCGCSFSNEQQCNQNPSCQGSYTPCNQAVTDFMYGIIYGSGLNFSNAK